jgi:hypothetical protein
MGLADGVGPTRKSRIRPLAWVIAGLIILILLGIAFEAFVLTVRYAVRTA